MGEFDGLLQGVVRQAQAAGQPETGDYYDDEGFLVCGNCHTRRQVEVNMPDLKAVPFDPMKTEMQKQLTDNIKKRGQLESLPFCALIDGKIEIISGHHRIRSAKDSGVLTELFVILDTTGLRRSQVAAKQLAHNAISGFDDQSTLKEIAKMIDDVDDMLESYIGKDIIGEPMAELEKLLSPKVEFDWKNVTFTFLPHQLRDLDQLVKVLGSLNPDMLGVADID